MILWNVSLLEFLLISWSCGLVKETREVKWPSYFLTSNVIAIMNSRFYSSFSASKDCLKLKLWSLFTKPSESKWGLPYYIIPTLTLLSFHSSTYKNLWNFFGPDRYNTRQYHLLGFLYSIYDPNF